MPLNFVDMSSNDGSADPAALTQADAVVVKATQGTAYTSSRLAYQVARARAAEKLVGFYHFADLGDPAAEFAHFWTHAKPLWHPGDVLVLDYEPVNPPRSTPAWIKAWADACHAETGVWPWIYSYGGLIDSFDLAAVAKACPLWVAGGPYYDSARAFSPSLTKHPSVPNYWNVCAWQYSEVGRPAGSVTDMDLSVFWGTRADWLASGGKAATVISLPKISTPAKPTSTTPEGLTVATNMTEAQLIDKIADAVVEKLLTQKLGRSGPAVGTAIQATYQRANDLATKEKK